ncbi:MAG: class I SAM-dependent methyltransferase [Alphaproteobacteria bacterium]|nr:class I SAM-dependent methyltransferase [Alphaproteobacteria bacterium]
MVTDAVRAQYEAYPYPARDPRDEAKRLVTGSPSDLREIDHYLFAGKRDWKQKFRALVAGGGTGDALVMLAQHLADRACPAELHYLDLSEAARKIAEARIKARGLERLVTFHNGSLLDVAAVAPGPYDYVDCCGVLHHLADPLAGLNSLAARLAPQGGMGLMVYGTLGRTGVYDAQAMLRALARDAPDAERLAVARALIRELPATNRLRRNPLVGDHLSGGDAGIYDLLLHAQDRAYTVTEFARLIDGAGLAIASFVEPARYEPATYLTDRDLLARLAGMGFIERAAFAELLAGNLKTHVCYVAPKGRVDACVARPDDPAAVPYGRDVDFAQIARGMVAGNPVLSASFDGLTLRMKLPRLATAILSRIDGRRSLAEIHHAVAASASPGMSWEAFLAEFRLVYAAFNGVNRMLLRAAAGG